MSISLKVLFAITFAISFFGAFEFFFIQGSGLFYSVAVLLGVALFLILMVCTPKKYLTFIKNRLNLQVIKILLIFLLYTIISIIFHCILGYYNAPLYYYLVRIPRFYIYVVVGCLLPLTGIFLGLKLRDIIKLFYISAMIIYIIGIIQYISFLLHLNFMDYIFNFLTPERVLYKFPEECKDKLRVYAVFGEPSGFGQYIFITMPFITSLCLSKYKLFEDIILNKIFKSSLLPLMLLNIIFTKSPIYLVLCFLELIVLIVIHKKELIKRNLCIFIVILTTIMVLVIMIAPVLGNSIGETFLYRILKTLYSFDDFNKLVILEPSLATRILYYYNQFLVFKHNFLFGCGFHNADIYLNKFLLNSPLPLTVEAYERYYTTRFNINIAYSLIWTGLAEFGFIGLLIYLIFVIKNILNLNKLTKVYYGLEKIFCQGTIFSIISIFIISFYNINIGTLIIWIIYGISILLIANSNEKNRRNKCTNK